MFIKAVESWKIRLLHDGYCSRRRTLGFWEEGYPQKCSFCLIENPWTCRFRKKENYFLFKKLFGDEEK